jgi:hypothetical protein
MRTLPIAILALGAGCSFYEPMDGVATAFAADDDGTVTEVVAVYDRDTLDEFRAAERTGAGHADFDDPVREQTVFRHILVDYNAHGHGPPGVNDLPHIDAHFYFIENDEREAIRCGDEVEPDPAQVPDDVEWNIGAAPFGGCVDAMGAHGSVHYDRLTANMIYGFHDGKLAFVEPMIDVELLLAEEPLELDILRPDVLPVDGAYPTRFVMRYTDDALEFVLTDFAPGE